MKKIIFFSISFGQAEYNLSMNKKWTEQKYVIYFILSAMVLGVCGGVTYGASCCLGEELRGEEAELAWAAGEADERYVPYTASEQRVIEVEQLAYGVDGGSIQVRSRGQSFSEEEEWAQAAGQAGEDGNVLSEPHSDDDRNEGMAADTEAGTSTVNQRREDESMPPQAAGADADTNAAVNRGMASLEDAGDDAGVADQEEEDTQTAPKMENGADMQMENGADVQAENDAYVQTTGPIIAVSAEDYEALLRIVQAEAGNEDTKGKILVANVVLNRVADARFPNSVYEVVFQRSGGKAQFSPVASGSYYQVVVSDDTREAVDRALAGEDYSEGALFFAARRYAGSSQMRWFDECLTKLFSYGGHEFFTS